MTPKTNNGPQRDDRTGLLILDRASCFELLNNTPIGRIGFVVDQQPVILPVNFGVFEDAIVFRSSDGQKLLSAALGQQVVFEVDRWDASAKSGESVVIKGTARKVTEWAEKEQLEQLGVEPWSTQPWRRFWIRIEPTAIAGRRLDV